MGRRKNKTRKQKRQPSPPVQASQLPVPLPKVPYWKRGHKHLYSIIVFATLAITLLEGYPWLSIQTDAILDPSNAYSQMFSIANEGNNIVRNSPQSEPMDEADHVG